MTIESSARSIISNHLKTIDDLATGRKTAIAHIVEQSGVDESTVIEVLQALQNMTFPDVAFERLRRRGASPEQIFIAEIGVKDFAMAMILQHCGLPLIDDDQERSGGSE